MSSAGGIPNSSWTAAPDAQPATSYSGEGEHSRLAISAHTTSPTDKTDRALRGSARSTVLDVQLAQKVLTSNSGPTRGACLPSAGPTWRTTRQRLQLPGVLERVLPTKVCHNTMAYPAVLVSIPVDELQVRVLAARPLTLVSLTNMLPQHYRPHRTVNQPQRTNSCHNSIRPRDSRNGRKPARRLTNREANHQLAGRLYRF